jgi:hypothetical protein
MAAAPHVDLSDLSSPHKDSRVSLVQPQHTDDKNCDAGETRQSDDGGPASDGWSLEPEKNKTRS